MASRPGTLPMARTPGRWLRRRSSHLRTAWPKAGCPGDPAFPREPTAKLTLPCSGRKGDGVRLPPTGLAVCRNGPRSSSGQKQRRENRASEVRGRGLRPRRILSQRCDPGPQLPSFCLQALTPPTASSGWVSRPWDAMSQAGQLGGGAALGWESWGAPAFSEECSALEEEETWPEVRVGVPLEERWGERVHRGLLRMRPCRGDCGWEKGDSLAPACPSRGWGVKRPRSFHGGWSCRLELGRGGRRHSRWVVSGPGDGGRGAVLDAAAEAGNSCPEPPRRKQKSALLLREQNPLSPC